MSSGSSDICETIRIVKTVSQCGMDVKHYSANHLALTHRRWSNDFFEWPCSYPARHCVTAGRL